VTREPLVLSLHEDDGERVLAPGRVRRFYWLFAPLVLSFISCGVGGWLVTGAEWMPIVGAVLLGVGVLLGIGYVIFESFYISVIPARCYLRWLRERIDQRTDAVVTADDPNAFFVQLIPRKNWEVNIGENASDVGLLLLDHRNRLMKYEGDIERWVVPAECILSFRLRSFTPPAGMDFLNRHTVLMLRFQGEDDTVVLRPLAAHPLYWEPWTPRSRERAAECLEDAIGHFVDPDHWPRPYEQDLAMLIPPPD
jgi:hypothetical protein